MSRRTAYDGLLGDGADAFYKDCVALNWIAFRVRDSRYEFLGDFNYFELIREPGDFPASSHSAKEQSYAETKRCFEETGERRAPINRPLAVEWIDELGGAAREDNWCAFGLPVEVDDDGSAHPLTPDGRRFRFVGSITGFNYRDECADSILLSFDPQTSVAALTYNWS